MEAHSRDYKIWGGSVSGNGVQYSRSVCDPGSSSAIGRTANANFGAEDGLGSVAEYLWITQFNAVRQGGHITPL